MKLRIIVFFILLGFFAGDVLAYGAKNPGLDRECMKILDLLATMEGFNYSEVALAKNLFGDEKINFEVETWKGNCSFGIGTLSGRVVIVSNKPFKNPTLLVFTDSATLKTLFRNPDVNLFRAALKEGKIRIEPVGFAQGIKLGLVNTVGRFYPPAGNLTFPTGNISTEDDLDGDGVPNSADACDPYVLKEREGANLVKYYTCPSFSSRSGEEYYGSRPYDDIYDYVMENGCGVRDTDGGVRYYTRGSICVENVSFTPPQMRKFLEREELVPAQATSSCEVKYTDYCLDSETLVEYYYETPRRVTQRYFNPITKQMELREVLISGGVRNTTYKCPLGCSGGACIVRDLDSVGYPYDPAYYGNELRYGFNPLEGSYYGAGALNYVALKTGKRINDITSRDFFGDECIDERKLREYYLTVETTLGAFGRLEDRAVIKSEEFDCSTGCNRTERRCNQPTCSDGVQNQGETGIDCGGPCPPCNTKCRTGTKYAPPDTPCTTHYPNDTHEVNINWREGRQWGLQYPCRVWEVCHPDLDYIVEEALECCDSLDPPVNNPLCSFALQNSQFSTEGKIIIEKGSRVRRCVGLYIIKGFGDLFGFTKAGGWMIGYNGTPPEQWKQQNHATVPAEVLINHLKTGVCRHYAGAVTTMLRKAGYALNEVMNDCDGFHCFNLVKLPGDVKWHVVDTTGNKVGINIGGLPGGYSYCNSLNESKWCYNGKRPNGVPCDGTETFRQNFDSDCSPGPFCHKDNVRIPDYGPVLSMIYGCD